MSRTKVWIYHPRLKQRAVICVENENAVRIRKHGNHREGTQEQEKYTHFRARKLKRFAQSILELPGVISVREAARLGGVNRETARKYLSILKNNRLLLLVKVGYRDIYFVRGASQIDYAFMFASLFPEILRTKEFPNIISNASSGKLDIDLSYWQCVAS